MSKFNITAQIQLQAPANAKQVVQQIQRQLSGVNVNLNVQNAPQAVKQVNNLTKATKQASNAATKLGKDLSVSIKRYAGMAIATRAVSLFTNTLGNAVQEAIAFERELIKVAQVTGRSIQDLRGLTNEITRLSTALGASSTELINVSRILSQAGLSARETKVALDALARSTLAPTFDDITQTAEGAVAIFNQFGQGAAALEKQLGAINAVAGKFAVEAGDLIAVIRRTGGVFKAAGGDLNELIALFTSVRATTRESAESIATGLRTIFTRIQRPKTIDFLREFGVELTDLDGKFVGPFEAVKRLSNALAGLEQGDLSFIKIAEQLGGFRQIGKVIPLIQEFRISQEALNVAIKGGDSLTKDALTAQQALAVRISKVKEEFLALVRAVTETPTFQLMANTALNLASAFLKVADALKPLIPLIGAFAAINFAKGAAGIVGGLAKGFNRGGVVPGSGNRDTVPAMLTPGEFVIRKASAEKLGLSNLQNMNKYALGGVVKAKVSDISDGDTAGLSLTPEGGEYRQLARINAGPKGGYDAYETGSKNSHVSRAEFMRIKSLKGNEDIPEKYVASKSGYAIAANTKVRAGTTASQAGALATAQLAKNLPKNVDLDLNKIKTGGGFGRLLYDYGSDLPISKQYTTGRKFATGGAVGTDTIPALLTPGEFVVNRKSAQSVGYGALNRMNKFAKFADGGIVQGFQSGTSGSGAKPIQSSIQPTRDFLADEIKQQRQAIKVNIEAQLEAGKEFESASQEVATLKDKVSAGFADIDEMIETTQQLNAARRREAQAAQEAADAAERVAQSENELASLRQDSKNLPDRQTRNTQRNARANINAIKNSNQGVIPPSMIGATSSFTPTPSGPTSSAANPALIAKQQKLIQANQQQTAATSKNTTTTKANTASSSKNTKAQNTNSTAARKASKSMFGIGTKVAFASASFQAMLPALDENSSALLRNTHEMLKFTTAAGAAFEVLGQFSEMAGFENQGEFIKDIFKEGGGRTANRFGGATSQAFSNTLGRGAVRDKLSIGAGKAAATMTTLAGAAGLAVGAFMAFQALGDIINTLTGNTKALNDAIKEGKVAQAEQAAGRVADVKGGVTVAGSAAAGGIIGAAIGSIVPVIGTAIGGAIGTGLGAFVGQFLAPSKDAFVALAGAQAQAIASTKAMAQAQEDATEALADYQKGQISSDELLKPLADSTKANAAAQKKERKASQESTESGSTFFGAIRQAIGLETSYTEVDAANEQSQEDRNKQLKQTATPIIQARARAVAAAGGTREDFLKGLQDEGIDTKALRDAGVPLDKIFENITAEIARATKQFQALNLGLAAVNATSAASVLALENLGNVTNLADNSSLERSLKILEAGVTGAAMGISQADFAASVKEGADTLRSLGASADQIEKFETTTKGINQLQRSTPSIVDNMQKDLMAQAKDGPLNVPEIRQKFADTLAQDLDGLVDPDLLTDLTSLISDADLDPGDLAKIQAGDLSPLKKLVDDFGDINLAEFKGAMEDAIKVQKELAQLTAQRIDLENKLVTAQQGVINAQMEAAEIIAEFGGPAVTPEQRTQNVLAGANAQSSVIGGISNLQTGSADELRKRNSEIQSQLQSIQSRRTEVAQGTSTLSRGEGTELQAAQDRLTKLAQDQLGVTRKLIDARKLELKQIQARNAEEKKGLESLLEGDFESFFDAQAASGATAALATGNTQAASSFGSAGLAGAFKNLQNMQSQGVQSVFGQQIGGAGGLLEQSGAAALGQFGMAGSADVLAGTTQEEQAIQAEIRDLASTLPETAQIQADAANMLLEAAKMQIRAAEAELAAIGQRMSDATGGEVSGLGQSEFARGGMVYASRGIFVPKGTDTVPAMLTPGEFVVRRSAVQRGNNLSILKSMNSGGEGGAQGLSRGGRVNYLANGGQATGGGFGLNAEVLNNFSSALNNFNTQLAEHIQNLQNIQLSVTLAPTNINVNLTGTSFLETLTSTLKSELMNFVSEELKSHSVGSGGKLTKDSMGV